MEKKQYINQQHYFTSTLFSNLFSSNEEGVARVNGDIDNVKNNKIVKKATNQMYKTH